jgi:hypothetical protein
MYFEVAADFIYAKKYRASSGPGLLSRYAPLILYNWQNSLTLAHFKPWPRPNTITFNQKGGFLMMHVYIDT